MLAQAEAIRRECRALIEPVEAALRVSWLPLELNSALIARVEEISGREATRSWVHASLLRSMKGTLLKPVVDGLTRLGLGPQHGLRRCSYGWNLLYKNAGHLECTHAEIGKATLVMVDAPAEATTESYLRALASAFEGVAIGLGGQHVEADFVQGEHISFSVRWAS